MRSEDTVTKSQHEHGLKELSAEDRQELLEYHPIIEREYILPTPMMERCYSAIRECVWARRTGLVLYGPPRMGKTRCSFAVKDLLMQEFSRAYVTLMTVRRASHVSGAHICRQILNAEGIVLRRGRLSEEDLMLNVLTDIEVKLGSTGGKQYILIIDEAHLLNNVDLQQLVCIHNALEQLKIRMTTISFAQPEIQSVRTALMASRDRQIIARFLSEMVPYCGCTGVVELQSILKSYDENSEFPEGSGWSFTRFFVPIAYENGFRLEKFAHQIWARLTNISRVNTYHSVPMEHTCLTVENLLQAMRHEDCSNLILSKSDIDNAIASSQLKGFLDSVESIDGIEI